MISMKKFIKFGMVLIYGLAGVTGFAASTPADQVKELVRLSDGSKKSREGCDEFRRRVLRAEKSLRPLKPEAYDTTLDTLRQYPGLPKTTSEALALFQNGNFQTLPRAQQEQALKAVSDLEYCETMVLFQGFKDVFEMLASSKPSKEKLAKLKDTALFVIRKDAGSKGPLLLTTVHVNLLKRLSEAKLLTQAQAVTVTHLEKRTDQLKGEVQAQAGKANGSEDYTLGISSLVYELKGADEIRAEILGLVKTI